MKQYLELLQDVLQNGVEKGDRTGTGTLSIFGRQMRFDLSKGFPLVTTKKMFFKGAVAETLWFLRGDTNTKFLEDNGVTIWREWETESGEIGPMYGKQLRNWSVWSENTDSESRREWDTGSIDQIRDLVDGLKSNPNSRRHVITTWNPADLPIEAVGPRNNVKRGRMALAPCHGVATQFYVRPLTEDERIDIAIERRLPDYGQGEATWGESLDEHLSRYGVPKATLSCFTFQRSADTFLGLPFNIASYALLTHVIAQQCGYGVGELIYATGDTHLYKDHIEQAKLQLSREPFPLPKLKIRRKPDSIFDYKIEDFKLDGYESHPAIKADVSI